MILPFSKNRSIFVLLLVCLLGFSYYAEASHFRYSTLSWKYLSNYKYRATIKVAFRYAYFEEWLGQSPYVGFEFQNYDMILEYTTKPDRTLKRETRTYRNIEFTTEYADPNADWITANCVMDVTFPSEALAQYGGRITYYGTNRISNLENNSDQPWNISSTVPLQGLTTANSSPVSGMLPIVPAYMNQVNSIPVLASHSENPTSDLEFSLSKWSGMTQPSGLTIDKDTGIISYSPTSVGLWCTQVVVKETNGIQSSITVDFIINVTAKAVTQDKPPYFEVPPTPAISSYVDFVANQPKSFDLKGVSPQASSKVTISVSNLPSGMNYTTQVPANPNTMTFSWKPTPAQVGVYIFSGGLVDSKGIEMNGGVHSFYLRVSAAECGNGHEQSGVCVCDEGWTGEKCDECEPDYYGPLCLPLPPCHHGQSNGGTGGDGKCICDPGYQGPACNISVIKYCSNSDPNAIIKQSIVDSWSSVSPDYVQVSLTPTGSQLLVPLQLTGKNVITAEIFILFDTSVPSTSKSRYQNFITQHNLFRAFFASNRDAILYGLGTFSDTAGQSNSFQLNANPMMDITSTLSTITLTTGSPSANIPYQVLIDAIPKIGFSNSGTMKIIYLVTDNNLAPTDNTLIPKLVQALDNRNVLLGVFALDSVSSYAPLFTAAKAGYSYAWPSSTSTPWFNLFINNLYTPMIENIVPKVVSDQYGIVSSPPPTTNTTTWYTGLLLPTPTPSPLSPPQIKVNVVGFDKQTISVAINHAPTTNSLTITTNEDTFYSFAIVASDIDLNLLNISFTELPTNGVIQINGTTITNTTDTYVLPSSTLNAFKYIPNPNAFGSDKAIFSVTDGCLSATGEILITINPVNDVPTCQSASVSTDQNTAKTFTLNVIDVDSTGLTVEFVSSSTSLQLLGTLKTSTGAAIVDGTKYPSNTQFVFTPFVSANGSASFNYVVRDGTLSSQCIVSVQVTRVNVAPILTVQSPVNMIPDSIKAIPFTVRDSDNGETLVVSVTAATPVGGSFSGPQGQALTGPFPIVIGTYDVSSTHEATDQISYHSANNQDTGVSITLKVTDKSNTTDIETIQITITGTRINYAPTATPVGPIVLDQDTLSQVFLLNGTDPDQARGYDNILDVVISSYPRNGQLQTPNGAALSTVPFKTALSVVYAPNPGYFGNDQLIFYVVDSLGNASQPVTVQIIVNHVNHAPAISASDVFVTGRQGQWPTTPISISASDIDQTDQISVSVTQIPLNGNILKSDGSAITGVPAVISNLSISYAPSATTFYSFVQPYTVKVCDNYTPQLCSQASANIHYTYVNSAPVGEAITKEGVQDQTLTFDLVGSDFEDGNNVVFYLATLPTYGKIYSQGVLVNSTTQVISYSGKSLSYVPNQGVSNDDTPGKLGPVESLFYVIVDKNNTKSTNYPISLYIVPVKPPIYIGEKNFTTLEDTPLSIALNAISQYGSTSFQILFTKYTNRGQIYFVTCTSIKDPNCYSLIDPSQGQTYVGPPFNLMYYPPPDQYDDEMDQLSFILIEKDRSTEYTINIAVLPVNDPPVFVPMTYTGFGQVRQMAPVITITVNSTTLLTWNATDIDSPYSNLISKLQSNPKTGKFLSHQEGEDTPSNSSHIVVKGDTIERSADGLWRLFYVPTPGRYGKGLDSILLNIIDDKSDSSPLYSMRVDVNPVNLPPVVTVNQSYWEVNPSTSATILGVSVDDPDSNRNNISFTLTLSPASEDSAIELPLAKNSSSCTYNSLNVLTCVAPKATLNQYLALIKLNFSSDSDNYTLNVFVNDLGYVGGNELTDQKDVSVKILSSPVSKPNNTTILSVAIAAAAAGAALIAVGVWRLLKSTVPPTDAFFGDSPFAEANINTNPLYEESNLNQMNPLYEA